jgi:hypothetical protein
MTSAATPASASIVHAQGGGWGPPPGAPPGGYGGPPGGYGGPPGGYGPPAGPPGGFTPPPGGFGPPQGGGKPITGGKQTIAMHQMSIDPTTGLPRGEKPPASNAAVISLVCGFLMCLGPLTGIPAIIAGIMARRAIKADPANVGGGGMAIAGIVLGILNLLGWMVWFFFSVVLALMA